MWHPFDILGDELFVDEILKHSRPSPSSRAVYGERVTKWFKDKSDTQNQWPPTVDRKPGIEITKRQTGSTMSLEVVHTCAMMIRHRLDVKMECVTTGWRSPSSWSVRQTFANSSNGREFLPGIEENGRFRDGVFQQEIGTKDKRTKSSHQLNSLASIYPLMANFPSEESAETLGETNLLQEGFTLATNVALAPVPEALQAHPKATGLRGRVLLGKYDFPADYWFNEHGVVVYMLMGPHRAFVLEEMEELS